MNTLQAGLMALITATAATLPTAAQTAAPAPAAAETGVWTDKELANTTWEVKVNQSPIECLLREGGHVTSRKGRGMNEIDVRKWELRDGGRKIAFEVRRSGMREGNWLVFDYKDARSGTPSWSRNTVGMTRVK